VEKNNQNVNMLKNMHAPWAEGNFCDENKQALTPAIACAMHGVSRKIGLHDKFLLH
jgi:hypothetical protein